MGAKQRDSAIAPYLLDTAQTSVFLSVPEGTLRNWRSQGKGPRYVRITKGNSRSAVRYKMKDLIEWADALEA